MLQINIFLDNVKNCNHYYKKKNVCYKGSVFLACNNLLFMKSLIFNLQMIIFWNKRLYDLSSKTLLLCCNYKVFKNSPVKQIFLYVLLSMNYHYYLNLVFVLEVHFSVISGRWIEPSEILNSNLGRLFSNLNNSRICSPIQSLSLFTTEKACYLLNTSWS